jgi:hypothetical protein
MLLGWKYILDWVFSKNKVILEKGLELFNKNKILLNTNSKWYQFNPEWYMKSYLYNLLLL